MPKHQVTLALSAAFEILAGIDAPGWQRIAEASSRHVSGELSLDSWRAVCETVMFRSVDRFCSEGRFEVYKSATPLDAGE